MTDFVCAIKDLNDNTYYQQGFSNGWYGKLGGARFYLTAKQAQKSMESGNHHVNYPGGRNLAIVPIEIRECSNA